MCKRYSLSVVAPTQRSSPRAKAGSTYWKHQGAVRRTGAHQRMEFVDKEHDIAAGRSNLFQDRFQALFELTAIFGTGD